jgi:hypothetical protein
MQSEFQRLAERLFSGPGDGRTLGFQVSLGDKPQSVAAVCGEINKALDQVDAGLSRPSRSFDGDLPQFNAADYLSRF